MREAYTERSWKKSTSRSNGWIARHEEQTKNGKSEVFFSHDQHFASTCCCCCCTLELENLLTVESKPQTLAKHSLSDFPATAACDLGTESTARDTIGVESAPDTISQNLEEDERMCDCKRRERNDLNPILWSCSWKPFPTMNDSAFSFADSQVELMLQIQIQRICEIGLSAFHCQISPARIAGRKNIKRTGDKRSTVPISWLLIGRQQSVRSVNGHVMI